MTASKTYAFTITAADDSEVTQVLLHIIGQADKNKLGIDYHVSITDPEEGIGPTCLR